MKPLKDWKLGGGVTVSLALIKVKKNSFNLCTDVIVTLVLWGVSCFVTQTHPGSHQETVWKRAGTFKEYFYILREYLYLSPAIMG